MSLRLTTGHDNGLSGATQSDLSDCASVRGTAFPAVHTGGTPVPRFTALCIAARSRKGGALAEPSPTISWSPLSRSRERGRGEREWPVTTGLKPRPSAAIFMSARNLAPALRERLA